MRAHLLALALLPLLPLLAAGCIKAPAQGLDATSAPAAPAANAALPAPPEVALAVGTTGQYPANPGFDPATLRVKEGSAVRVTFTDAEQLPLVQHDLVFEKIAGAKSKVIGSGEKTEFNFTAPAKGTYAYYCDIGDHRQRGMEGTLTVE